MTDAERLQFYLGMYKAEVEHREHIRGAFAMPVAVQTVFFGLLYRGYPIWWDIRLFIAGRLVGFFFLLSAALLVLSASYLARAYIGYSYSAFQRAGQILQFEKEWAEWSVALDSYGAPLGQPQIRPPTIESRLIAELAEAADLNASTNRRRSALIYSAGQTVIAAGVSLALGYGTAFAMLFID